MSKELLRQAINALTYLTNNNTIQYPDTLTLLTKLRIELAKTEPEPVAWMSIDRSENRRVAMVRLSEKTLDEYELKQIPLYSVPPARKPLSEDDIISLGFKAGFAIDTIEDGETGEEHYGFLNDEGEVSNAEFFKFVRLIEKAHGIGE